MDKTARTIFFISFVALALLLFFGGGKATAAMVDSGIIGNSAMGGIIRMWIPAMLVPGLGGLLVWLLVGQTNAHFRD